MRSLVLTLGLLGTLLFGTAFALSHANPLLVERAARELVRMEVERRTGAQMDALLDSRIATIAKRQLQRIDAGIDRSRQALRDDVPHRVSQVVADMLDADCACRKRLADNAMGAESERLSALTTTRDRLRTLIESTYASVARKLMREFRIFTGSNAAAFALLFLVTLTRRGAGLQLALPAIVLTGAVAVTGGLYLFKQNWLHTIIFDDYTGFAYMAYLAIVAALLADILLDRARVTTRIVNTILRAFGSAASAVPC
jgi:hypothetical protein